MGQTIFEKIVTARSGQKEVKVGDIVEVKVDRVMIHDFFIPFVADKFREMGFPRLWDPDRVVFVYDHLVPTTQPEDYRHHRIAEEFAREFGITNIHRSDGVCHQLMHECGYLAPGDIVLGTDSHTTTYGALGALATGIGYTEMAAVLGTGQMWMKVVPTIKVEVNGALKPGVSSKDIILKVLEDLKADGAAYKVLEFCGSTIEEMDIDSRLTLSNMSVEAGAKAGLIAADEKTAAYLKDKVPGKLNLIKSAPGARYKQVLSYRAEELEPLAACPYNVDNIKPVSRLKDIKVDQVFLGSCTNGRLEDIKAAAQIMEGCQVAPGVRFYVVPASRRVYKEALQAGYISTLARAGAIINHPSCSLCAGRSGGLLENGDVIVSTNNRNFLGRMGGNKVGIYLTSPATAAASALSGRITAAEV